MKLATILSLLLAASASAQAKVLFLTHSAGFRHGVVNRHGNELSTAERALQAAARGQFEVVATDDCGAITASNLENFSAVVFYTTGELPISSENRDALLDFVNTGGGFVGVHSATDTFYRWPEYGELIGGYFDGHPWHQKVRIKVEDPSHPAMARLGRSFEIMDEIYQFKSFSRDRVHVLMSLDTGSVDAGRGKRGDGDYALAWSRSYGNGRVFYTALGHRPEVWADPRFRRHLVAGIRWAMNGERVLARPPKGATVLFDGTNTDMWTRVDGKPVRWKVVDGALEVTPRGGSIITKQSFEDFRMHIEFRTSNHPPEVKGQKRGNSGVYIQRRYEVQILDSHSDKVPLKNGCGAIYRRKAADVNVCRPAGVWQSYDITFRAPRWSDDGKKTANARITVIQNGVVIHDDYEIPGKTGAGQKEGPAPGPILLQDHGNPVRFRNVWMVPMSS